MARSRRGSKSPRSSGNGGVADRIVEYFEAGGRPLKAKDLSRQLEISKARYPSFRKQLRSLTDEGVLVRGRGGRFALAAKAQTTVGSITITRGGDGFVSVEGATDDIFVPGTRLSNALSGDTVRVRVDDRPPGKNAVGTVIEVLEQLRPDVVGTYERVKNFGFVVPLNPKVRRDILIPQGDEGSARHGDVVRVTITLAGSRGHGPLGAVKEVFGPSDDPHVASLAIAKERGFELEFPPAVERAAREASERPLGNRIDRTEELVFTIDPADAKDHDDALSVRVLPGGAVEVGVHIADVSHYVPADGPIDVEARHRATSVYLVDRVIPMLPHVLSTDLCSLVPGTPRPALSVFMTVGSEATIDAHRFERTVIVSRHRLSYETAQAVLDREESLSPEADEALRALARVARGRRELRVKRGSLDFDFPEPVVELGPDGRPVGCRPRPRLESHRLVEDLMLMTNELVARESLRRGLPVPFRTHAPPSGEGLERAVEVLRAVGYRVSDEPTHSEIQRVLEESSGSPVEPLVHSVILRAMKRAEYTRDNVGHFGLAAPAYLHFTSPIRRYPDLIVHRAVVSAIIEGRGVGSLLQGEDLVAVCERSSLREREAEESERDSLRVKQVELMEQFVGETLPGVVTSITPFGAFVRLDDPFVEGLIHVSAVDSDFLEFDSRRLALVGRRTGLTFAIGQRLRVTVARVDRQQRQIDFVPAETDGKGR